MITAVMERCAGIDVGKKSLSVCVMVGPADREARHELRPFGTTVAESRQLRQWIESERCSHVVMESTGTYWKPIFNILEDSVHVILDPHEVKARKGRKTDHKDVWWLAHLLRHAKITVMDPKLWTAKKPFLRWWAALKMEDSGCPEPARVTHRA